MSSLFTQSRKRRSTSQSKKHQTRDRLPKRRRTLIQTLEQRQLLAADGFAVAPAVDTVPAEVSTSVTGSSSHSEVMRFDRIVNGTTTQDYDAVGIVNGGCSGTLIAPNAVLTAAHCISDPGGEQTFTIGSKTYTGNQAIVHPEYGSKDIDLAVILLSENIEGVQPMEINRTPPKAGQLLTLVGFGGQGTASGGHDGSFGIKNVGQTPLELVTATSIEWDYDDPSESNTAPGDSGGPAFIEVDGKMLIAGVTSGGTQDNAGLGDHSFDTRVDSFASWIDAAVSSDVTTGGGSTDTPVDDGGPVGVGDEVVDFATAESLATEELDWLDTNQDGNASRVEMIAGYKEDGDTLAEATEFADYLINDFDANGDGSLNLSELIASYGPTGSDGGETDDTGNPGGDDGGMDDGGELEPVQFDDSPESLAKQELADYDSDGNGALSYSELQAELTANGATAGEASDEANGLLDDFDANQNGELGLNELVASWGGDQIADDDTMIMDDTLPPVEMDDVVDNEMLDDEMLDDGMFDDGMNTDDDHAVDPFGGCDVNLDGNVSPLDALLLINQLAEYWIMQLESSGPNSFDVNADGSVTPLDAMMVINRIAEQSGLRASESFQMIQQDDANDWQQSREVAVDQAFAVGSLF